MTTLGFTLYLVLLANYNSVAEAGLDSLLNVAFQYLLQTRGEVFIRSNDMPPVEFVLYLVIMNLARSFGQTDIDFFENILPAWIGWPAEPVRMLP